MKAEEVLREKRNGAENTLYDYSSNHTKNPVEENRGPSKENQIKGIRAQPARTSERNREINPGDRSGKRRRRINSPAIG